MSVLRLSTLTLGVSRKALGIGVLGIVGGVAGAVLATAPAMAQTYKVGSGSDAQKDRDVGVGVGAIASGGHSVAFGDMSEASGLRSAAMGSHSIATGQQSAAMGEATTASANYAVAVGSNGTTASAIRALALGAGAVSSHVDAVAIGSNATTRASVAVGSVKINGVDYSFAGARPTSVFSIGSAGSERQIVNVAAGQISANSTDAVNGSQLFATNQAVTAVDGRVTTLNNNVVNGAIGVVQRAATGNVTVLTAAGGTAAQPGAAQKLTNLAGGAVNSASTEAINGGQLYAASQSVATHLGGNATVGANGAVNGPKYTIQGQQYSTVYDSFGAVNSSLTTLGETANRGWDLQANGDTVTAVKPGNKVQFLDGRNIKVTRNGGDLTIATADDLNVTSVTAGNATLTSNGLAITGGPSVLATGIDAGNLKVANVAAGDISSASSTDAVNGGQLYATNEKIKELDNGVANGSVGVVQRAPTGNVTVLTAAGGTAAQPGAAQKLTNLAGGDVSSSSTEAINGGQLYAASKSIADHLGGNATVGANGAVNGPSYTIQGQQYSTVYDSFGAVNSSLTTLGETANRGWDLQANGDTATAVKPGNKVQFLDGRNIKVTRNGRDLTIATADDLNVTSVTAGNATLTSNGLAITGGPSVLATGIDAGNLKVANVAAGDISSASSTDAVNGGQLYATNEKIKELDNGVANGAIGVVQRAATPDVTVLTAAGGTAAQPGAAQKLTNLAGGAVNSASTEAINGGQLYAASQSVATHLGGNATVGANGAVNGPSYTIQGQQYSTVYDSFGAVNSSLTTLGETANRGWDLQANDDTATAVKPGNKVQFLDGQNIKVTRNGGDLTIATADDLNVTSVTAGNATLTTNGLAITGGPSVLATGIDAGNLKVANVAAGDITSASSTDAVNGGQLYATNEKIKELDNGVANGAIGVVQRTHAPNVTVLTAAGGTAANPGAAQKLANLANGDVSSTSTEAINGAQLYAASASIANHLGGGATVGANGVVNGPTYVIQGQQYSTVYDSFGAVDNRLTTIGQQVDGMANGGGIKYFHSNSQLADSQAVGANSTAIGPQAIASGAGSIATGMNAQAQGDNSIALGANATASNAGDVAIGSGSSTQAAVQTSTMTVNGKTYDVAGTATATVSFGSEGAERTVTNVAAGRVSASSTDAINGSQLYATNQALESLGSSVGVLGQNAVMYDTDSSGAKKNSITLQGGDANAPVLLSNVATGVADNDAVNVKQLKDVSAGALASANRYTDDSTARALASANTYTDQKSAETLQAANSYTEQRFSILSGAIGDVRREARQAAAVGLAASSLRYDNRPGKISMAVGGGAWRGEGALAIGLGYTSESQMLRANISATSSGRQWGVAAGLSLTLN
ncbi:YadA-like family protein [Camelimonas lactis]|nr:YadA-like family protein [Camelimonas lactis]